MKKLILIAGCAAFLWIIITGMTDVSDSKKTDVPQQSYVEESTDNVYYQLKEYDKRVAAFSSESKLPIYVSSVYVSELPKEDRLRVSPLHDTKQCCTRDAFSGTKYPA